MSQSFLNKINLRCHFLLYFFIILFITSCKDDVLPKPAGYLRLDYPEASYNNLETKAPFVFEINQKTKIKIAANNDLSIEYPQMKATIYVSYKPVNNNIKLLLRDAQKLTYEHVIKADDILEQPYLNPSKKTYGMFYKVNGNAATNSQFYITDSTKHFLTASVYFYAKPNFDSIMPAVSYLQNDMQHLIETLRWK